MSTLTRMVQRRGTTVEWTTANPVLLSAEIGYDKDLKKFKIGDGVTPYNMLPYSSDVQIQEAIDAQSAVFATTYQKLVFGIDSDTGLPYYDDAGASVGEAASVVIENGVPVLVTSGV